MLKRVSVELWFVRSTKNVGAIPCDCPIIFNRLSV